MVISPVVSTSVSVSVSVPDLGTGTGAYTGSDWCWRVTGTCTGS